MINKLLSLVNAVIRRKSYWYNNVLFKDCRKFWYLNTYNLDVINLGSTSANAAFVYSQSKLKGYNLAMSPQTFVGDYEVLRNYSCFLKEGATILIPLCPFSSLGGYDDDLPDKYYSVLNIVSFPHSSFVRQQVIADMRLNPIKYYPLIQLFSRRRAPKAINENEFDKDADKYMNSWKKQFSIYDWNNTLTLVNQDAFKDSAMQLEKIINYCLDRQFNPVIVIPPVSKALYNRFTENMMNQYIYSFIKDANRKEVPLLDYFGDSRFTDFALYRDSYTLNNNGAILFTHQVLLDLQLI